MDWVWLLFRFEGRINRAKAWLAVLVILSWMIFLAALTLGIGAVFGGPTSIHFDVDDIFTLVDPEALRKLAADGMAALLIKAIGTPLFTWVYVAASVKRLHDRDRSGWWMLPFFVIPGLYCQFSDRLPDSYLVFPFSLAIFVFLIWGFVEIFCLKGSRSTNQFGPNPLPKQQTRPRGEAPRSRAAPAWDQHSEIKFVPHSTTVPTSPPTLSHGKRGHE